MNPQDLRRKEFDLGNYINNSFGQFDNYTPMQLAQYVATIANNGVRLAPHIVEGVYGNNDQGGLGSLVQETATKELKQGQYLRIRYGYLAARFLSSFAWNECSDNWSCLFKWRSRFHQRENGYCRKLR